MDKKVIVKGLSSAAFAIGLLSFGLSTSVQAVTIEVTTTEDQNGEDNTSCSLREAIQATLTKQAYGGCIAGQRNFTDVIKLDDDSTYTLSSEIAINTEVSRFFRGLRIDGPSNDPIIRDPITGVLSSRNVAKPLIKAADNQRIFNTAAAKILLTLNNIRLEGSGVVDGNGGAILSGGTLTLFNVSITNAEAAEGGAIFLEGVNSSLNMTGTLIEGNKAKRGAFLSQNCFDNLSADRLQIKIDRSSIANNVTLPLTAADKVSDSEKNVNSIFNTCGIPNIEISDSSFVDNTSQANQDDDFATIHFSDVKNIDGIRPQLTIKHSTIVGNKRGLRFDEQGVINITDSIIAYNDYTDTPQSGTDCSNLASGEVSPVISFRRTLLVGQSQRPSSNPCQLPQILNGTTPQSDTLNSYVTAGKSVFFEANQANDYGLGLKGYLPKVVRLGSADAIAESILNASNVCEGTDMRGLSRVVLVKSVTDNQTGVGCYKGAIERGRLTAVNSDAQKNFSYVREVERIQASIDREKADNVEQDVFDDVKRRDEAYLSAFKASYAETNDGRGYRQAYVSIFNNNIPFEQSTNSGQSSEVKLFPLLRGVSGSGSNTTYEVDGAENYTIEVLTEEKDGSMVPVVGTSSVEGNVTPDDIVNNDNVISCAWDANLNELIIWRTNGSTTPAGQSDYCFYKITSKNDPSVSTIGYASAKIENIEPVAEAMSVNMATDQASITVDLSGVINDDGDGPNKPARDSLLNSLVPPDFYQFSAEVPTNYIEIVKQPELGRLEFDAPGTDCPNPNQNQIETATCYSPNFRYVRNSTFSDFNDSFTYRVYDGGDRVLRGQSEGSLASNTATVTINVARATSGTNTPVIEGGGTVNWYGLLALMLLAGTRYGARRYH